ncbi:hypothetical protein Tco_0559009 [Tanacetum coccineum]
MEILLGPTSNKLLVGSYKDGDGVILFRQRQVHYRMLILDQHTQRNHESSRITLMFEAQISLTRLRVAKEAVDETAGAAEVKFNTDAIDETNLLEDTLRPCVEAIGGILDIVSLSGYHITPCI